MMQKPVTEGMTAEQLKNYNEEVREARRGNVSNAWSHIPASGISKQSVRHTMSDDLSYSRNADADRIQLAEDWEILAARQNKAEQIANWQQRIAELTEQIKAIESDANIAPDVKNRKINNRKRIINHFERSINDAVKFIEYQKNKARLRYDQYIKIK